VYNSAYRLKDANFDLVIIDESHHTEESGEFAKAENKKLGKQAKDIKETLGDAKLIELSATQQITGNYLSIVFLKKNIAKLLKKIDIPIRRFCWRKVCSFKIIILK